jgi:hypothetical protein
VGGDWPQRIEAAARYVFSLAEDAPDDIGPLLYDIREEMDALARIGTRELVTKLREKQDPAGDWDSCHHGRPINAYYLRERLKQVIPQPRPLSHRQWREGNRNVKGYNAVEFADGYRRYLRDDNFDVQAAEEASQALQQPTQKIIYARDVPPPGSSGTSGTTPASDTPPVPDVPNHMGGGTSLAHIKSENISKEKPQLNVEPLDGVL